MRREEFKEITEEHIETAKKLVEAKGDCDLVDCERCPFFSKNLIDNKDCGNYSTTDTDPVGTDEDLLKSAQEFLLLAENNIDKKIVGINKENDNVNSPNHYRLSVAGHDVEVIDIIKAVLTPEEFRGYLKGNNIKYIMRENNKNHIEDLEKCRNYLDWLIERDKNE